MAYDVLREKLAELDARLEEASKATERATLAEHTRKIVQAKEALSAMATGASAAKAEFIATASERYQQAVCELAVAEADAMRKRGLYYNRREMLSVWQTVKANERAEMKLAGQT